MTLTQSQSITAGYEPLPGYVLEESIGRGGFGEVWRCSAPGGLEKAIKFVFGAHDQSRAARELRSLERIKGIRHPFLLTLERFEVVDNRLVILTELADESLEDVYRRNRKSGSCGIPRDILTSQLHDIADGLDYLHESYRLQHLDVKPGNMLMIGGHVKVADFGLLKDLRDIDCSIVGGLTPIYAPPELFDGRPSLHSDQYSLAVMFQELLTGTRPFSGRTIAQLATQHVHSTPNLEPLPPSDRVVAARALEKDPERRFASCRDFVEALLEARRRKASSPALESRVDGSTPVKEESLDPHVQIDDLPQLIDANRKARAVDARDVLVVAIGGTGAECVLELRHRLSDLRNVSPVKLHSVLIDTDMNSIHSMRLGEASERVPKCDLIYTPLKSAHEYRQNGTDRLRTISRRWIYNVPRSLATEGMRPLGRLALVDHGPDVQAKLAAKIETLVSECQGRKPLVYVVGSLAGGTGSGMYIDVVHLLRHLLDKADLADTQILSLLTAASLQVDPRSPIALHNTQAAISEIKHFMRVENGYPGDPGAEWPSLPAARTPLHDLYIVSGASSGHYGLTPVETITEYLWADSTGCDSLLQVARALPKDDHKSVPSHCIRSVGVAPLGDCHRLEEKLLAPSLVGEVMMGWLGSPVLATQAASESVDRFMRRVGLSSQTICDQIHEFLIENEITAEGDDTASIENQISVLAENGSLDWLCAGWVNNLYREISLGFSDRKMDLVSGIELLKQLRQKTDTLAKQVCRTECRVVRPESGELARHECIFFQHAACHIARVQLEHLQTSAQFMEERMERFATILAIAITETKSQVGESNPWDTMPPKVQERFGPLCEQLHHALINPCLVRPLNDRAANVDAKWLMEEMTRPAAILVIAIVEQHCREISDPEKISAPISPATSALELRKTSVPSRFHSLSGGTQSMDATQAFRPQAKTFRTDPFTIEEAIDAVRPTLLALGGLQRVILVVSNEIERGRLEPELRDLYKGAVTVAVVPGADPRLIHEAQQIDLKMMVSRLSVLNGGNTQVTARLASRTDIDW